LLRRYKITKRLEELFNLPETTTEEYADRHSIDDTIQENQQALSSANDIIDRIDQALPQVHELDSADDELDELSDLAKQKFEDLMDLGMNVEARFSGTILQTAGVLLGHAISAKQAKIDKKLRMVDLQLKKMRLDQTAARDPGANALDGQATLIDRNELLSRILAGNKPENSKK
jgi:hypothetical protein